MRAKDIGLRTFHRAATNRGVNLAGKNAARQATFPKAVADVGREAAIRKSDQGIGAAAPNSDHYCYVSQRSLTFPPEDPDRGFAAWVDS
ncbi:MAG: hypothetical protein ABSC48_15115 [Terracidiphilus sp.]|jgi:hypothetical protein